MAKKKPETTEADAPEAGGVAPPNIEFSPPKSIVLGDVVLYTLTGDDASAINRRRTDGASISDRLFKGNWHPGAQAHIGEPVTEGDVVPMTVTRIDSQCPDEPAVDTQGLLLSGQCTLNGTDSYWVRKAAPGVTPGRWQFAR
jgi:hypothetical protein